MLLSGQSLTVIAVTANVTTRAPQQYRSQCPIKPSVFATMTQKVAETVENPVAIIAASFLE